MQIADTCVFDYRHCLLMGRVAFSWKSGDNISPKCHIRAPAARFVTKPYDIAAKMAPLHTPQNQIITMLR